MEKVDAIILAGGRGTRIREVAGDLPKVLLPVSGKPFLDIILQLLDKSGKIGHVILAVGHMRDKIIERYQDSYAFGFRIVFSVETELLGTGGAINKALGLSKTDDVFVFNGDSYLDVDIQEMLAAHKARNASMTLAVTKVPDAGRYGRVVMDLEGRVSFFEEKKADHAGGYINAGVYLIKRNLFEGIGKGKVISLEKDLLPSFLDKDLYGFPSYGKFIDIGIPETYKIAGDYLKE